jgi:hemerythrin-like domain-containing protein
MKAAEILKREHRVIERVATACGTCAEVLEKGTKVPANILQSIVEVLCVYGDQYHRAEEQRLFRCCEKRECPPGAARSLCSIMKTRKSRHLPASCPPQLTFTSKATAW